MWSKPVPKPNVPYEEIEMMKLKSIFQDWDKTDVETLQWKVKMMKITIQLLLLDKEHMNDQIQIHF